MLKAEATIDWNITGLSQNSLGGASLKYTFLLPSQCLQRFARGSPVIEPVLTGMVPQIFFGLP